jgi:dienelactone hydrolase
MLPKFLRYVLIFSSCFWIGVSAKASSFPKFEGIETEIIKFPYIDKSVNKEIILDSRLLKPNSPAPWNLIVLGSNCSGLEDKFWRLIAPDLLSKGYAVLLADVFNPRGFSRACENQLDYKLISRINDPFVILTGLRSDSRFKKIAWGGHSTGAGTAFNIAYQDARRFLFNKNGNFYDAYFGVAASCEATFKETNLDAPLLLISGTKDDYTLPEPCVQRISMLKSDGQPGEIHLIEGVNHEMSTSGWIYLPKLFKFPKGGPLMVIDSYDQEKNSFNFITDIGEKMNSRQYLTKYGGFMGSKIFGATIGGNWDKYPLVRDRIFDFLRTSGFD